ncbi:hypothetical protein F4859DRAFT_519178 [Xylaria cf. heliscus]|nr:hypothetical protein F4859DRAFT_519178 [Xylaria cf. heliscus]
MSSTMTMTQTQTMTPLERTRSRSNSGSKGRRTRVHFEIEDATPEFYGSKLMDFLSLYSGSSSFEVAIAALCSLGLFVAVGQGILEGPQLGIVAVLFLASIVHWALMFFFSGPQSPKNETLVSFNAKFSTSLLFTVLVINVPTNTIGSDVTKDVVLNSRATRTTSNDYLNGHYRDVAFFFTQGANQAGNMDDQPGAQIASGFMSALKAS